MLHGRRPPRDIQTVNQLLAQQQAGHHGWFEYQAVGGEDLDTFGCIDGGGNG
jgi:hypothetical protein